MKGQYSFVVVLAVFAACLIGVLLPIVITRGSQQGLMDPRLEIPNAGRTPTATFSTERALTRAEFARLFFTPTFAATLPAATFTVTLTPTGILVFSFESANPPTASVTPSATATRRPIFPTSTSRFDPPATFTSTSTPSRTPTSTRTATRTPTRTPTPTYTSTPTRTATPTTTPTLTFTFTPRPTLTFTFTPRPTFTDTPIPSPTDTPVPPPTDTPVPPPTDTPVPPPTDTPVPPPTDTPVPPPTDTPSDPPPNDSP